MSHDPNALPPRAGVGLKPQHYAAVLEGQPPIGFFEVHAENYMGAGGAPHRYLTAIRERYPLSLHGVGLSIGADQPLDHEHVQRLKALIARYEPGAFSEHLAWSTHGSAFLDDLLPLPYTTETLSCVARHIDEVQAALGRQILLENPSTYVAFAESTWSEVEFIAEVVRRTGCGLLLDVNNVFVSCTNQGWNPLEYIERFPMPHVREVHLAGHSRDADDSGRALLIDSHDREVDEVVWSLHEQALARLGPVPTLIEWDARVPEWAELAREALRADSILFASGRAPTVSPCREVRFRAVTR
ncbi:MAG: MNIO family bufferin maturase [Steroidobacteraceae bacterium]